MADQGKWFKLWCSAGDDPDIANLSLEDFGRWCKLGMYIKLHGTNGTVSIQKPAYSLQQQFRVSSCDDAMQILSRFPNCNTVSLETNITVSFRNWQKYQGDFSSDRVRKFRQMKRSKKRGEEKRGEENNISKDIVSVSSKGGTKCGEFKPEDLWIKTFLEMQAFVKFHAVELEVLLDPDWWERTATACMGIEPDFLEVEFAKMGNWLAIHKGRRPTRRFIQNWLEKAGHVGL